MKNTLLLLFIFLIIDLNAQDFGQTIDSTYDFIPHKLNKEEQQEKFKKLDSFFKLVIDDTEKYVPLLKSELNRKGHMPYFYYEGAHLLMLINKDNKQDDSLIINSFGKANLKDLSPRAYTTLITQLSLRGANTSDLAIEILKDTTFSFFIPQHSFRFNQGYCIAYILLPLEPGIYTSKLINAFDSIPELSKISTLTTLWFSYSCQGDLFLISVKNNPKYSDRIRNYATDLLTRNKVSSENKRIMKEIYGNDIEEIWYNSFKRFSDEAIGSIDYVTRSRRQNKKCR